MVVAACLLGQFVLFGVLVRGQRRAGDALYRLASTRHGDLLEAFDESLSRGRLRTVQQAGEEYQRRLSERAEQDAELAEALSAYRRGRTLLRLASLSILVTATAGTIHAC
ncbi:MAG: hypothetical protein PVI30_26460 [Myxococcales bacterium]|jgi:hypothetical protein